MTVDGVARWVLCWMVVVVLAVGRGELAVASGEAEAWPEPPEVVPTFRYGEEILGSVYAPFFPPAKFAREIGLKWPPVARYDGKVFGVLYTAVGPMYRRDGREISSRFTANGMLRVRLYRTPVAGGWSVEPVRVVVHLDGERVWRAEVDANTQSFRVVNPFLPRERIDVGVRYPRGGWLWGRLAMDLAEGLLVGGPDFRAGGWQELARRRGTVRLKRAERYGHLLDLPFLSLNSREAGGKMRRDIAVKVMVWVPRGRLVASWYCAGEPGGVKVVRMGWYLERHRYLAPEGRRRLAEVRFERGVSVTGVGTAVALLEDLPSERDEWPEPVDVVYECGLSDGSVVRDVVRFPVPNRWFFAKRYGGLGPLKESELPWKVGEPIPVGE